jgi:hypothetical protein
MMKFCLKCNNTIGRGDSSRGGTIRVNFTQSGRDQSSSLTLKLPKEVTVLGSLTLVLFEKEIEQRRCCRLPVVVSLDAHVLRKQGGWAGGADGPVS